MHSCTWSLQLLTCAPGALAGPSMTLDHHLAGLGPPGAASEPPVATAYPRLQSRASGLSGRQERGLDATEATPRPLRVPPLAPSVLHARHRCWSTRWRSRQRTARACGDRWWPLRPSQSLPALPGRPSRRALAAAQRHSRLRKRGERGRMSRGRHERDDSVAWRQVQRRPRGIVAMCEPMRPVGHSSAARRVPSGGRIGGRRRGRRRRWCRRERGPGGRRSSRCSWGRSRAAHQHLRGSEGAVSVCREGRDRAY